MVSTSRRASLPQLGQLTSTKSFTLASGAAPIPVSSTFSGRSTGSCS